MAKATKYNRPKFDNLKFKIGDLVESSFHRNNFYLILDIRLSHYLVIQIMTPQKIKVSQNLMGIYNPESYSSVS